MKNCKKISHLLRLVTILKLLETSERTIENLALVTRVSERTVRRDLDIIRSAGFSVVQNAMKELYLVNNYGVPKLSLTYNKAEAMGDGSAYASGAELSLTYKEAEAIIFLCTEYLSNSEQVPTKGILSALLKIAESVTPDLVPFLQEKMDIKENEIFINMFNEKKGQRKKDTE